MQINGSKGYFLIINNKSVYNINSFHAIQQEKPSNLMLVSFFSKFF